MFLLERGVIGVMTSEPRSSSSGSGFSRGVVGRRVWWC
jgi:hypothetical protein